MSVVCFNIAEAGKNERLNYLIETSIIAIIINTAPIPVATVRDSLRKSVEIVTETIISFRRITVEVTGEIFRSPLDQK